MLRPKLTTISLTRADVADVVHRRRFRKCLEGAEDDACATFIPDRLTPVASHPSKHEEMSETYDSTGNGSRPPSHTHSRTCPPLAANLPLPQHPLDQGNGNEDAASPSDVISSHEHLLVPGTSPHWGSTWASQLCLRPKSSPLAAATRTVELEADNSGPTDSMNPIEDITSQGSLQQDQMIDQIASETTRETRPSPRSPVGHSSRSQHVSSSEASANGPTSPIMPFRVCQTQIPRVIK